MIIFKSYNIYNWKAYEDSLKIMKQMEDSQILYVDQFLEDDMKRYSNVKEYAKIKSSLK